MSLMAKEDVQFLKEQAYFEKKELQKYFEEIITERDKEHKKELESMKREMKKEKIQMLSMQKVCKSHC